MILIDLTLMFFSGILVEKGYWWGWIFPALEVLWCLYSTYQRANTVKE